MPRVSSRPFASAQPKVNVIYYSAAPRSLNPKVKEWDRVGSAFPLGSLSNADLLCDFESLLDGGEAEPA